MKFRRIKVKVHILSKQEAVEAGLTKVRREVAGVHFTVAQKGPFVGHYIRVKTGMKCCEHEREEYGVRCTRFANHKGLHRADDCWDSYYKEWDEGCEPWAGK